MQQQVKSFLKNTFLPKYYNQKISFAIGWKDGVSRSAAQIPPEVEADFQNYPQDYYDGAGEWRWSWFYAGGYIRTNPNNFYAMWKYVQNVAPEDTQSMYELAKYQLEFSNGCKSWQSGTDCSKVSPTATDSYLQQNPWENNAYIAGYTGFLQLQQLAGKTTGDSDDVRLRTNITAELARITNLRLSTFTKDTPFTTYNNGYGRNQMNISRNFLWLTPELGDQMHQQILPQVQQALDEYNTVGSYWFVSRFNSAVAESGFQNLYDYSAIFQARAWILKQPRSELAKWLDVPAFEKGDLFYIQNLVSILSAS